MSVCIAVRLNLLCVILFACSGFSGCGGGEKLSVTVSPASTVQLATAPTPATPPGAIPPVPIGPKTVACTTPAIALTFVARRQSGVAPLAVFFDATATTATVTTRPFHDIEYRWNFGDIAGSPVSGATWGNGSRPGVSSRNTATGPVAAHVFETPGTYTVTLTAFDGVNTATGCNVDIVVQDPDVVFAGTKTICFSATGTFTDVPSGFCTSPGVTAITTSSFVTAISMAAPGTRLLFRRTETFTTTATPATLAVTGPGTIGAYGTGAPPKIRSTAIAPSSSIINISTSLTPVISDWRLMDLEFDGQSNPNLIGIIGAGGFDQLTMLRLNLHDIGSGLSFAPDNLDFFNANGKPGHHIFDQLSLTDSTLRNMVGGAGNLGAYIGATQLSFQGNLGDDSTMAEHVVRLPYVGKGIVSNNTLQKAPATKHALTIRGPCFVVGCPGNYFPTLLPNGTYTEQVVVSDNKYIGLNNDITVQFAPSNGAQDERLRNIISERNWYVAGAGTQFALIMQAAEITVRNEICDMTGALFHTCIAVGGVGTTAPASDNIRVFNNTFYSASTGDFIGVSLGNGATNLSIKNNLGYAPATTSTNVLVLDNSGSGPTLAANSTNLQARTVNPLFTSIAPFTPSNAKPRAGSYAIGSGVIVPVWSDFFGVTTPTTGDIGAVLH